MSLLGIDVGTTHCKVGLFQEDGVLLRLARQSMHPLVRPSGERYYDPEGLWNTIAGTIQEVTSSTAQDPIRGVGIASMAETGAFFDRDSGVAQSEFIPWFDKHAQAQADRIAHQSDPLERFIKTGMRIQFKCGLSKMLFLLDKDPSLANNSIWLSIADFVAFRLTGAPATDYSLAGRTFAFDIIQKDWDSNWLQHLGLGSHNFPPAKPAGISVGGVDARHVSLGLRSGTPVVIAGHDHVCAAFALGAVDPGQVIDSMGTAESIVGILEERSLGEKEFHSGLVYGRHVVPERMFWMGGLSDSGGAVAWLRSILGSPPPSFEEIEGMLATTNSQSGSLLFFPYLTGSASPKLDPAMRAAFVGLSASHNRADLVRAVLEGAAFAIERARRSAERTTGMVVERVIATGGSTRSHHWMQIKADVSGCIYEISEMPEATLLGAALLAGIGAGVFKNEVRALAARKPNVSQTFFPDPVRHDRYCQIFENEFMPIEESLSKFYGINSKQ